MALTIRPASADDAPRITEIYNQGIADRGATFETEPRTVDGIRARIEEAERVPLLCRACGFREVGVYEKHAQLDGKWLDVVIVERLIPENQTPHAR